ncbi:MAG: radical SAM protein [Treponema sp.]|nr:radical SAM protein [Treponema sp.]
MTGTIHFETLGCRLNHDESEGAARFFSESGFTVDMNPLTAASPVDRDVVLAVINTCTVTGKAEQKARRIIRLMLEKFPVALVIVTGCYAALDGELLCAISTERISIIPGTGKFVLSLLPTAMVAGGDLCIAEGLFRHDRLDVFIQRKLSSSASPLLVPPIRRKAPPVNAFTLYTNVFQKHSRATLKLQDGCNCECSYCRIHLARGASVSLPLDEAVRRARKLEETGVTEAVLTGVNLSQWRGEDGQGRSVGLASLVEGLLEGTDRIFFRLSSLYPESVDEKLCAVLAHPRVQPFFHLSIQSGSDRILQAMRRPHSLSHVDRAIARLREIKENPFISCDIIAGFPGESEEDFAATKALCEKRSFAWIHAFPFSARPGTPAMSMKGQVPESVKGERVAWLTRKAVEGKISYAGQWEGRTLQAVVEHSRSQGPGVLHAVTGNYLHVECPLPDGAGRGGEANGEGPASGSLVNLVIGRCLEDSIASGGELDCLGTLA